MCVGLGSGLGFLLRALPSLAQIRSGLGYDQVHWRIISELVDTPKIWMVRLNHVSLTKNIVVGSTRKETDEGSRQQSWIFPSFVELARKYHVKLVSQQHRRRRYISPKKRNYVKNTTSELRDTGWRYCTYNVTMWKQTERCSDVPYDKLCFEFLLSFVC